MFKGLDKLLLVLLSIATCVLAAFGLHLLVDGTASATRHLSSAGLLATAAGIVQLEVSGFFQKIFSFYDSKSEFPSGPPSNITREIIDNPDRRFATWCRNIFFFDPRTGFWFILGGTLVQVTAVWV